MIPANDGDAAEVPEITKYVPFSAMTYPSCAAAVMATSGTARIPFASLVPITPFCQVGCAYTTLAPPPDAHSPEPPFDPLWFQTCSGI